MADGGQFHHEVPVELEKRSAKRCAKPDLCHALQLRTSQRGLRRGTERGRAERDPSVV